MKRILIQPGTPIAATIGLASLAAGGYRQSAKIDLQAAGDSGQARRFNVRIAAKPGTQAAAGTTLDVYWAASPNATNNAGDNPAGTSGADAAYTGYSASADDSVKELEYLGSLVLTAATVQHVQDLFPFEPSRRYGMFVVKNTSAVALTGTAADHSIVVTPIVETIQ
jgi:hypothetical protein